MSHRNPTGNPPAANALETMTGTVDDVGPEARDDDATGRIAALGLVLVLSLLVAAVQVLI